MELPEADLTAEQREFPPDWVKKDTQARIAESLLRALDPEISIQWVREDERPDFGQRRVIQLKG